jgi:hypothetical protein
VLVGQVDRQRKVIIVVEAWSAPRDSKPAAGSFLRGCANLRSELAILEADTRDYLTYVGEWHTHPPSSGAASSSQDRKTMARLAAALRSDRVPAVCIISNGSERATHVYAELLADSEKQEG